MRLIYYYTIQFVLALFVLRVAITIFYVSVNGGIPDSFDVNLQMTPLNSPCTIEL